MVAGAVRDFKLPFARANLEIFFSCLYIRCGWFIGIEPRLGPVDLGSISHEPLNFIL